MKNYILFFFCFLLMFFILFIKDARGKEPVLSSVRWGDDIRIGDWDSVNAVVFDVDYSTGNLFAALNSTYDGTDVLTVHVSTDTGRSWSEITAVGWDADDIDAAVFKDHFYVAHVTGSAVFIERYNNSDGSSDNSYGYRSVLNEGIGVREIALVSTEDFSPPARLYCFAITDDDSLRCRLSDTFVTSWSTFNTGIGNASRGLDACCSERASSDSVWCSYIGTNDSIYIGSGGTVWNSYGPLTDVGWPISGFSSTSIAAYDITARKGDGFGVVIADYNYAIYTHRDYPAGEWSDTVHFTNPGMTAYRIKPSIECIATNSYGIAYVDYPTMGAWFDISQWPESGIREETSGEILLDVSPLLFNTQTSMEYILPGKQNISLDVYNILGNHIKTLVSGEVPAGSYSASWDGRDDSGVPVASGVYLCVLKTGGEQSMSRRLMLIR
ncbi:MAG: FlgD immunoglobulin-like domain containing protein [candidate division WOR-3 bacterium]